MSAYIVALVIQMNNDVFLSDPTVVKSGSSEIMSGVGSTKTVPCPDASGAGVIDAEYWANPVTEGAVSGFTYEPYTSGSSAPTPQSFRVVRISSKTSSDFWYVVGTQAQYLASCAVCCGASPVDMPTISAVPKLAGCQTMCQFNNSDDQKYFATLGLPTIPVSGYRYFPYGYFNGVALPAATVGGYGTLGALLTFLNTATTGWAAVGTWTINNGVLVVTQTAGSGADVLCAQVVAINPSA